MIARIWAGAVHRADRDAYIEHLRGPRVVRYAQTPGNRGVWMLHRDIDDRTELVMFTLWESLDAVKVFADDEDEFADFYAGDERVLIGRDLRAAQYEVDAFEPVSDDRPARLAGERVVLRPLGVEDVERIAAIQAEAGVARWWGAPDETELRHKAEGRSEQKALAIERDGELIGLIEFHEENEPDYRHAGIDVFLAGRHHGTGLGTDAVRTLARYLIRERGHHRLTIDPAADNAPAIRAYEKVGFRAVGLLREYERSPNGNWHDGLLMDLLAHELDTGGQG